MKNIPEDKPDPKLEAFYVYRSLHSDESWGAVIVGDHCKLPNCDFLMKVFDTGERRAIARARKIYEQVHKFDTKRDNVKRFAAAALKSTSANMVKRIDMHNAPEDVKEDWTKTAASVAMKFAIALEEEYESYFKKLELEDEEIT